MHSVYCQETKKYVYWPKPVKFTSGIPNPMVEVLDGGWFSTIYLKVRLMCAFRAHIKFSIFENIFLIIEKIIITFLILENFF